MKNLHRHIANANFEEAGCPSSQGCTASYRNVLRRTKRLVNRRGKRLAAKIDMITQDY